MSIAQKFEANLDYSINNLAFISPSINKPLVGLSALTEFRKVSEYQSKIENFQIGIRSCLDIEELAISIKSILEQNDSLLYVDLCRNFDHVEGNKLILVDLLNDTLNRINNIDNNNWTFEALKHYLLNQISEL